MKGLVASAAGAVEIQQLKQRHDRKVVSHFAQLRGERSFRTDQTLKRNSKGH